MLKARGFPGKYLAELKFLKDNGAADQAVLDSIETYDSLLVGRGGQELGRRRGGPSQAPVQDRPDVPRLDRAAAGGATAVSSIHAGGQDLVLGYIKDILASSSRASVIDVAPKAASFAEAFKAAREAEADYFALVSVRARPSATSR